MNTKSFGQFLHERGLIDGRQLLDVLEQQGRGDAVAVAVEDMDAPAAGRRALMSRLLIEGGHERQRDLAVAELEYAEQSMVRSLQLKLTLEHARSSRIAEIGSSVLQGLYKRVMGSSLELGVSGTDLPRSGGGRVWSQAVHIGDETYTLAMQMTDRDALGLAAVVLGIQLTEFDELAEDAVSEFLNIVIGHICGNLSASDGVRADPPRVTSIEEFNSGSSEAVVLECDGDDIVFHFALP